MTPEQPASPLRKIFLVASVLIATAAYAAWQFFGGKSPAPTAATAPITTDQTPLSSAPVVISPETGSPTATTPTQATSPMMQKSMMGSRFNDGAYIGDAVDAFYGIVQVKAIVTNGRLADVQFLQFPNDRDTTIEISNRSMPVLAQEAIQIQSAKVNIISGATQTSEGFQASLASALTKAQ